MKPSYTAIQDFPHYYISNLVERKSNINLNDA